MIKKVFGLDKLKKKSVVQVLKTPLCNRTLNLLWANSFENALRGEKKKKTEIVAIRLSKRRNKQRQHPHFSFIVKMNKC